MKNPNQIWAKLTHLCMCLKSPIFCVPAVFRGASILSRVRPTIPIPGQRGASSPAQKRSILTLLGRVGRTGVDENGLEGDESGAAAAAAAAAAVYGLYDGYTAAPG
jgi:hypothetical protein